MSSKPKLTKQQVDKILKLKQEHKLSNRVLAARFGVRQVECVHRLSPIVESLLQVESLIYLITAGRYKGRD